LLYCFPKKKERKRMRSKRILIIDDDIELCGELSETLMNEGYDVSCLSDPKNWEELIKKMEHDIILLDYKMPGITGLDILKRMKEMKLSPRVYIISGKPFIEEIIRVEGLADMVAAVIPKPVDFAVLLSKIESV
jgi:DNA-binding response OmpR family regulator